MAADDIITMKNVYDMLYNYVRSVVKHAGNCVQAVVTAGSCLNMMIKKEQEYYGMGEYIICAITSGELGVRVEITTSNLH